MGARRVLPMGGSAGIMVTITAATAVTLSGSTQSIDLSTDLVRGEGISRPRKLKYEERYAYPTLAEQAAIRGGAFSNYQSDKVSGELTVDPENGGRCAIGCCETCNSGIA